MVRELWIFIQDLPHAVDCAKDETFYHCIDHNRFGICCFVLAGGIYDILEHPISLLPTTTGYSVLIKGTLGEQTLNESLIAGFLYMLGIGGLYMLLRSTRFAYRPRNAYMLLIVGTITVLIVAYYSNAMIVSKLGG